MEWWHLPAESCSAKYIDLGQDGLTVQHEQPSLDSSSLWIPVAFGRSILIAPPSTIAHSDENTDLVWSCQTVQLSEVRTHPIALILTLSRWEGESTHSVVAKP
jgi:hypothetical protein